VAITYNALTQMLMITTASLRQTQALYRLDLHASELTLTLTYALLALIALHLRRVAQQVLLD
jgi:hypothetical protein